MSLARGTALALARVRKGPRAHDSADPGMKLTAAGTMLAALRSRFRMLRTEPGRPDASRSPSSPSVSTGGSRGGVLQLGCASLLDCLSDSRSGGAWNHV